MKVYIHPRCSTCKKAITWLIGNGIEFEEVNILELTPTTQDLENAFDKYEKWSRLFNTSGMVYRSEGWKEKLKTMDRQELFSALHSNGMLIKRPFIVTESDVFTGFKVNEWESLKK